MSSSNLPNQIDKNISEDSPLSNSTNNSFTDSLIPDLSKIKDRYLITKNLEQKIVDILSFLQSDANVTSKIQIIKYIQTLFLRVCYNSEIFMRKFTNDKDKLNLYQIIIYQYILYSNSENTEKEEENYRSELKSLLILLLSQMNLDKGTYRYIISFLVNYINEKNIANTFKKPGNLSNINCINDEQISEFKPKHLSRLLQLLIDFYQNSTFNKDSPNYFFFSGDSDSSITISNRDNLLNLDEHLCILLFINVLPSDYIKKVYPKIIFRLLELRFHNKNRKKININIDIDNKITADDKKEPFIQLLENETNCVLIRFYKENKMIKTKISARSVQEELTIIEDEKEKKSGKTKDEIKEIILFKNFIGTCSNIIIYKEKKNFGLPPFLFSLKLCTKKMNNSSSKDHINNTKEISDFNVNSLFPNGFHNEELFSNFVMAEKIEQNDVKKKDEKLKDFSDFLKNKLISMYIPTRVDIPSQFGERTLSNTPQLILRDSINNLDAEFSTKTPSLNGVHIYSRINNDFSKLGGINNLLPIIEIMTNNTNFLTPNNFSLYFSLIFNYILSNKYPNTINKDNNSHFFMSLSYFLEKIPDSYFDEKLNSNLKMILNYISNIKLLSDLTKEFINFILLNEKIFFKFNEDHQKIIIDEINSLILNKKYEVEIITIINILLYYDREKKYKFCCKEHAEYFNDNYSIMDIELSSRIKPIKILLENLFMKKFELIIETNKNNSINANNNKNKDLPHNNINNYEDNNNYYYLFYLLSFDISPCMQKTIISLIDKMIKIMSYRDFVKFFDKKEELFDIILFVFRTSIVDVKNDALNLLFIIENNNNGKHILNDDIKIFIKNEIVPTFLQDEVYDLEIDKNDENLEGPDYEKDKNNENKNNDLNNQEKEEQNENENENEAKNIIIEEIKDNFDESKNNEEIIKENNKINEEEEKKEELNEVEYKKMKEYIEINNVKYKLFSPTDNQKLLNKKYNKKKFNDLINESFNIIFNFIKDNIGLELKLDLLTKIVSIKDLSSIKCLISQLSILKDESEISKKKEKGKEKENNWQKISKNQQLLHWLIETTFQIYILKNQYKIPFMPGFSIESYSDKEQKHFYDKIYDELISLIKSIININFSKADYLLTWSKYYIELIPKNDIFRAIYDFVNEFFQDIVGSGCVSTLSNQNTLNDLIVKNTLYYFDLCFELYSFYNLQYNKEEKGEDEINKFMSVLLNKKETNNNLEPEEELNDFEKKINYYNAIIFFYINISPIWTQSIKDDKESISTQILGKSNSFLNVLEILFYDFNQELYKDNDNSGYGNTGIPLIIIIYHFFIGFFNIGGNINEFTEKNQDFRKFIKLIIISSSTLNSSETSKKKKWPNEEQYKKVQEIVEYILFKFLYYFYKKIKKYNTDLDKYKLEIKKEEENTEKTENLQKLNKKVECLLTLKSIYLQNMGYLLKLLITIYFIAKSDEKQKKHKVSSFFLNIFKFKSEGVRGSGPFLLIDKIYNESSFLSLIESTNNIIRKTMNDIPNSIDKNNEKENNYDEKEEKKKSKKNNSFNYSLLPKSVSSDSIDINGSVDSKINESNKFCNNNSNLTKTVINNDFTDNKNNNKENNIVTKYLNEICDIDYEKNLSEKDLAKLEININKIFNDESFASINSKYGEKYENHLYSFMSIIKQRYSLMKNIIPIYDNRKNLTSYPKNICLVPYYYPENIYQNTLINNIKKIYNELYQEIEIKKIQNEFNDHFKCNIYKNIKKTLFKFHGIWSYQDYFYDQEKYKLKYKLLNHMTNDFTRIMMTPILDINYYLPKFSAFKGDMFRNNNESLAIPITKAIDLSFGEDEEKKDVATNDIKENLKKDNKSELLPNETNDSTGLIIKEEKQDNCINQEIPLYEYNKENYQFLNQNENEENDYTNFLNYIKKTNFDKNNEDNSLYALACLVKLAFHIRGIIYINDEEIGFYSYNTKRNEDDIDYDKDRKSCFGSVFKTNSDKYNKYYMKIPLKEIELIFKRRYFFKRNVLEIYTQKKKSYFFRINESEFDCFYNKLKSNFKFGLEDITIEYTKFEEKIGLVNKNNIFYNYNNYNILFNSKKCSSLKSLYTKWTNWEISTFTLLNVINIYSNRGYNDINQYPVFPWIITDYTSDSLPSLDNTNVIKNANAANNNNSSQNKQEKEQSNIRPFNTPMGMLEITDEAKERKEDYIAHWETLENDDDKDENYDRYGSHYSTSLYLTYYLVRIFPFSYIRLELQGKKFDDPNRLFNSLSNSFECAITQKADLRELIPEFFCFPEMFYNINELNFGEIFDNTTKTNVPVNDIEMPPWSNKDAYIFVEKHRTFLESIEISEKINEWLNLIFGSKQKGKEAKAIRNLFIKQTYEDFDEIHNKADPKEQIYQKRMVEFGVTPSQIFKSSTSKRSAVRDLRKRRPILYNYQIKKRTKKYSSEDPEELEICNSEIYLEGTPYKMFSSLKKNDEEKNEKLIFLYKDKIKIISKMNEIKKNISSIISKDKNKDNKNKDNKINVENEDEDSKENEFNEIEEKDDNKNNINEENHSKNELDKEEEHTTKKETNFKYSSSKYRMNLSLAPTLIYDKGNYTAFGGFWNGDIIIYRLEDLMNKKDKSLKLCDTIRADELSPIIHMKIDLSETFVICTNKIGTLYIYIINNNKKGEWILKEKIHDSKKEITSISINENLNIFAYSDKDGYINIYTLPNCKLVNSYKLNENILPINTTGSYKSFSRSVSNIITYNILNIYADEIIISQSPLPCLIIYIRTRKSLLILSINFHFIKEVKLDYEIIPNGIKKYTDYFNMDFLFIYNQIENTIDVYDLIDCDIIAKSQKIEDTFIDFIFNKEMDHVLIMVKIKDDKKVEKIKDKTEKNYKILFLKRSG